ncbi:MAG: M55 family metallopeptidase [Kiritimatiellae bacterium]|nr:M55 family metallopeptidase [Kiritimatiellia bacterium]
MRIYIMTDMEGVSGIRRGDQGYCKAGEAEYARGRKLLTGDVNAAVEGALEGGAREVVVDDAHGGGNHILVEELHPRAVLESPVSGRPGQYLPSLGRRFDALFIVGAHAMAGTRRAFLDHTQSGTSWFNYYLNGKTYGEIGQYALIAGHYGVPVVLVTGDLAATQEARALLGKQIETVAVKEALSRHVAKSVYPPRAQAMIRQAAKRAMSKIGKVKPLRIRCPIKVKLELQRTDLADAYDGKPHIRRVDARTITCTVPTQADILNF